MSNATLPNESSTDDIFECATCSSTLNDAVLLKCLHSVCRSCTSDATPYVTCPVCQVTTDISIVKTNFLVSSLVQHSFTLKNVFSCKHCIDETNEDATAVAWCYECQQPLCIDLQKYHKIFFPAHKLKHLNECTVLSELYRPPLRHCTKHGEELKLACFTCQDCRCYKCVHDSCYRSSHDVQLLDSAEAVKRINDRVAELTHKHSYLKTTTIPLQSYLRLPEAVVRAQNESLSMLLNAKKTAIESINRAYAKAESSLLACWDTLISTSLLYRESVERLQARLDWTNKYCELALSSTDITGVFLQLETIFSSLCDLLVEAKHIEEPVDPSKMVSSNVSLPCDLDLITGDWLGQAKVLSEDFNSSVSDSPAGDNSDYYTRKVSTLKELEQQLQDRKEEQMRHQNVLQSLEQLQSEMKLNEQQLVAMQNEVKKLLGLQKEQQQQLELERRTVELLQSELKSKTQQLTAPTKPLCFSSKPHGTFKGPGTCWDVALTPHGSLLVAAWADGLKEYDATSFDEVATWEPDADLLGKNDDFFVRTVDVLSDGRALVGLEPKLILMLRRDVVSTGGCSSSAAEAWRVERRVAEPLGTPRRLSAWDDRLLAVLEDRYDESTKLWCCGPGLVLLSLSDGDKQLHRQQLDFNACCVVLTDRGVVLASDEQVELTNTVGRGGSHRKCYVVDCYSHVGVRLWRLEMGGGEKIMSVCSDMVGRVIYATKCRGPVVALSVDDGRELSKAVTLSTAEIGTSYAIAIDKATHCRLALVTVYGEDKPNCINMFTLA